MTSGGNQALLAEQKKALIKRVYESQTKASVFAKTFLGETFFPYNQQFADCNERLIIYRAGSKVGKTFTTAIKALHAALYAWQMHPVAAREGQCDIIIIAPTQSQASIMFGTIKDFVHRNKVIEKLVKRETYMQLDLYWFNLKGVSRIFTRATGERGDSLRGYRPHIIIADEAAFIRTEIFRAIVPRGLATKCHIWLISTPYGRQGYFYQKSTVARPNKQDGKWIEFRARALDNPLIKDDPEYYDEVSHMTADEAVQELEGEFLDFADAMIPQQLILDSIHDFKVPDNARYFMGVDIAGRGKDETVYTIGATDDDGNLYVISAEAEKQSNQVDIVGRIRELMIRYRRIETIFVDETTIGVGAVDMAKRADLPVRGIPFSKKSKTDMYHTMRLLFEEHKIHINRISKLVYQLGYLRREFMDGGAYMKVTSDEHDDYCSSLALLMNAVSNMEEWQLFKGTTNIFG